MRPPSCIRLTAHWRSTLTRSEEAEELLGRRRRRRRGLEAGHDDARDLGEARVVGVHLGRDRALLLAREAHLGARGLLLREERLLGAERRLAGTLKRLRDLRRRSTDQAVETTQLPASPRPDARLTVTVDGRTHLFEPAAIAALRAEGDYTRLQLADGRSLLVGRLLGAFETALHGPPFVRLSRSLLINCDHIAQVTWIAGGRCRLALVEGAVHYDLGRAATKRLRALLSEADNRP
mgnify:CR=1 FL=1